ncbi:hypothetical protein FXO37_25186, partial [Capsicum annuum]
MRNLKEAYLSIYAHRGSLTSLALHRHAPLVASDSSKQLFKIFNLEGEQLGTIRYLSTFMVQRIGSVRCLTFHPYQVLLAAGAADACVSVYVDEVVSGRWILDISSGPCLHLLYSDRLTEVTVDIFWSVGVNLSEMLIGLTEVACCLFFELQQHRVVWNVEKNQHIG